MALVCDKCASAIPEAARFCPSCGDPVTDADRPQGNVGVAGPTVERATLVCPKCSNQELQSFNPAHSSSELTCSKCNTAFRSRIGVIRGKRSSQSKKENQRRFSVRLESFGGDEHLVEFVNVGLQDFELRPRDLAAFTYLGNHLRVVQNLKIRQYWTVSRPSCFVASVLYGPESDEVFALRRWRDECLLAGTRGRWLVARYYGIAPLVAQVARRSRAVEAALRLAVAAALRVLPRR